MGLLGERMEGPEVRPGEGPPNQQDLGQGTGAEALPRAVPSASAPSVPCLGASMEDRPASIPPPPRPQLQNPGSQPHASPISSPGRLQLELGGALKPPDLFWLLHELPNQTSQTHLTSFQGGGPSRGTSTQPCLPPHLLDARRRGPSMTTRTALPGPEPLRLPMEGGAPLSVSSLQKQTFSGRALSRRRAGHSSPVEVSSCSESSSPGPGAWGLMSAA